MTGHRLCLGMMLAILPTAGCGTVANLARPGVTHGGKIPFGGVKHDRQQIADAEAAGSVGKAHALAYKADIPLSFVGDVITWPYTATYTFINAPVPVPPIMPASTNPGANTLPQPRAMPDAIPLSVSSALK